MAFFPGNFIHVNVTAMKLQCRVFLIPWVKRNDCISCRAKARDYSSSSFPVKYITKRSSKNEENEAASLPVKYWEKRLNGPGLSVAKVDLSKNSNRSFLNVDSNNHDGCSGSDISRGPNLVEQGNEGDLQALNDEPVEEPDKIVEDSSKRYSGIQLGHSRQDVEKLAIELLASRAFTTVELKKKLKGKKFPLEIIDVVITDFQSRGLINDFLYAESYSRSRWSSSSWGPRRIRQALFKKGISEVEAEKAIKLVFENSGGDGDEDTGIGMSKLSIDQLYVEASKQWQRNCGASQDTRKSRMVRWLQYRGFNWSVINYVLKKLVSESSSQNPHCFGASGD